MRQLRIPLRVVFYQDQGRWIAHCLEFDLLGDGATKAMAIGCLAKAIHCQVEMSLERGSPRSLFTPADAEYFEMFAKGKDANVAAGELAMSIENQVQIQASEVREYVPDTAETPNAYAHA